MMKKSKLLRATAKETLENVHLGQATVEMEFKYRHDGPFTLKATRRYFTRCVKALRRDRIFLHAAEKQIPMPVRIKTSLEGDFSGWWNADGTYHVCVHYNAYCQNCGRKVEYGVKGMSCYEHNKDEQYCQYCGQKLWWPKN